MSVSYNKRTILICRGTGCNSLNAGLLHDNLITLIEENKLSDYINLKLTGCHGFCQIGPTLIIEPDNILYVNLKEKDIKIIVENHLKNNEIVEELLYKDPKTGQFIPTLDKIEFYKAQTPIITENCGKINPEDINEYINSGGYESVKKVLETMSPIQVIEEIKDSRLRGRGGAGFTTGQKWLFCHNAKGTPKYLICNADEGDPGAFMDRSILESDPHSVIEGMIIAGYAIGANDGYIYVRAEYPLAIERVKIALIQSKEQGFLGKNILDSGFNFNLELKKGAGAFVCGEETALMASIMGKRGFPRPRPPYPATSGLWNKPTNINNTKTLAFIPRIIEKGAKWFSSIGTEDASGTIVIALTGKINNSGLVEIPMGTTLRELVYDIGGGILGGKEFKGLQTGGPSGGCIPKDYLDSPLDYYHLTSLGSIMGSGGFIVLDEDTCMVELARYFISFTQQESCGKCTPCRIGTMRMLDILTKITEGKAELEDLDKLEHIAHVVKTASLCALGGTAPNPVLTTLKYFREEYEAHILHKRCPAVFCEELIYYKVIENLCNSCGFCKKNCPSKCVDGDKNSPHYINSESCFRCGLCYTACPNKAIEKITNPIKEA
jgi:NADH:ubiquinone oxidoreductase subunit F (NADH-binding)/(2Fe-2S) ferredoxin/NAD-dependent dihydropyrimidine dehydrogenase PreA subunit